MRKARRKTSASRRYYLKHREEVKAKSHAYALKHPEEVKAKGKAWRLKHSEELKAKSAPTIRNIAKS